MDQPNNFVTHLVHGVFGIMAPPKSAKTTWGLSAPPVILHIDADRGLERAAPRLMQQGLTIKQLPANKVPSYDDMKGADIISIPYELPLTWPGQKLTGYVQLTANLSTTVQMACQADWIKTVFYDTGTVVWPWLHSATLEQKQIKNASRESLLPVEYAEPNAIQKSLYSNPRSLGKNVIVAHHIRQIRDDTTMQVIGETWDGWNRMEQSVDVFASFRLGIPVIPGVIGNTKLQPIAKIVRCGWSLESEGLDVPEFSFQGMLDFINATRMSNSLNGATNAL